MDWVDIKQQKPEYLGKYEVCDEENGESGYAIWNGVEFINLSCPNKVTHWKNTAEVPQDCIYLY